MRPHANEGTIAALATPAGTSALAVIRATGPACADLAASLFGRRLSPRRAFHGDYRSVTGRLLDDVVAVFYAGPASYTGEDSLEISSHGNPYIVHAILEDLCARGCRLAMPGEFTQRAYLNGRMDLSQAEAVMDVIQARSERALLIAQKQLRGSLRHHLEPLNRTLLDILARIEAYIDFPEEDLPAEDRESVCRDLDVVLRGTRRLLATKDFGEMLRFGIRTVLVGAPNVGKSSLLNRLVGFDRVLVSPHPGTTRDFVEESIHVGGHWMRLCDTAGLSAEPAELEKLGMEKTKERVREADLVLWVVDAVIPSPTPTQEIISAMRPENTLIVVNKTDLLKPGESWNFTTMGKELPRALRSVGVSAFDGAGFPNLISMLVDMANSFQAEVGVEAVAVNARHAQALKQAVEGLEAAQLKVTSAESATELLASDIRSALVALGEIAGRFDHEQMLDVLFSRFCIGK